mmetsp:Transcript_42988/g.93597  ORF Transcript_42988/g.93597 Transcript_42988/m.93597 type:complete len:201 (+) Transcript_42988:1509-2111(+)
MKFCLAPTPHFRLEPSPRTMGGVPSTSKVSSKVRQFWKRSRNCMWKKVKVKKRHTSPRFSVGPKSGATRVHGGPPRSSSDLRKRRVTNIRTMMRDTAGHSLITIRQSMNAQRIGGQLMPYGGHQERPWPSICSARAFTRKVCSLPCSAQAQHFRPCGVFSTSFLSVARLHSQGVVVQVPGSVAQWMALVFAVHTGPESAR